MTAATITEISVRLESVDHDDFIDELQPAQPTASPAASRRPSTRRIVD